MGTLKINNQEILTETAGVVSTGSGFPAGHIIQTVQRVYNTTDSVVVTSTDWYRIMASGPARQYYGEITGCTAGNDVMVTMQFPMYMYRTDKAMDGNVSILKDGVNNTSTTGSDIGTLFGNTQTVSNAYGVYVEGSVSEVRSAMPIHVTYIDTNVTAGTHNYDVAVRSGSSSNSPQIYIYSAKAPFVCTMMEISR